MRRSIGARRRVQKLTERDENDTNVAPHIGRTHFVTMKVARATNMSISSKAVEAERAAVDLSKDR